MHHWPSVALSALLYLFFFQPIVFCLICARFLAEECIFQVSTHFRTVLDNFRQISFNIIKGQLGPLPITGYFPMLFLRLEDSGLSWAPFLVGGFRSELGTFEASFEFRGASTKGLQLKRSPATFYLNSFLWKFIEASFELRGASTKRNFNKT